MTLDGTATNLAFVRAYLILPIAICAALLASCQSPPINVESAKAVIVQNETTKTHIKSFTDANKRTQEHVKKIEETALKQKTSLETAQKYLEELLHEDKK